MSHRERWLLALLALAFVLFLGLRLGAIGFFDPDEGRYASIPVAMLRTGDYVVPQLGGFPYLEKPPLLYWLTAGSFALFGRSEFAGRLPVLLFGLLGLFSIFCLGKKIGGVRLGLTSAGLLALTVQWYVHSRLLTTDMILAGAMTAGLTLFFIGSETGRRAPFAGFYAALAAATLAKGLIGIVLPGLIIGAFILLSRRWRLLLTMRPGLGVLIFGLLVIPWFLLVQQRFPEFIHYFLIDQHVSRFAAEDAEHIKPFWFYIPILIAGFFPWIFHLPAVLRPDRRAESASARPARLFCWLWLAVIFGFFSVSRGKLMSYLLPAYPPLAFLVAQLFDRLWEQPTALAAWRRIRISSLLAGLACLGAGWATWRLLPDMVRNNGRLPFEQVDHWPLAFAIALGFGGLLTLAGVFLSRPKLALAGQAGATAGLLVVMIFAAIAIQPWLNPKPIGDALAREVQAGDPVVCFKIPQQSLEYYIGRPPLQVAYAGEYKHGISLRPNPEFFEPDEAALDRILTSGKSVFIVADKDDQTLPGRFKVPVDLVAQNAKRVVFRTRPGDPKRVPPVLPPEGVLSPGSPTSPEPSR